MTVTLKPSRLGTLLVAALAFAWTSGTALAQKKYDPGATDTEEGVSNAV